jgi:hypothetical protein
MADYAITFARSARRELEALDTSIVRRVISRIDGLAQDPRRPALVSRRANRICGESELEITGLFTASMIDNGLLILSGSAIGEKSIDESKSNHTVHRTAAEKCRGAVLRY